MAAGVCLGLVAQTVRDEVLPLVIQPFVQVRRGCGAIALAGSWSATSSGPEILSATAQASWGRAHR
jgi:hypothetical protein